MKISIVVIFSLLFILLNGMFFVGEMVQTELFKLIQQQSGQAIKVELINNEKSFFTAKVTLKVTIPIEDEKTLQFLIDTKIYHYPYKATAINHIVLLPSMLSKKAEDFFQTKAWLISSEEVNLLGTVSGQVQLVKGELNNGIEHLQSEPLTLSYLYYLGDDAGFFNLNWAGFKGEIDGEAFNVQNITVESRFSTANKSTVNNSIVNNLTNNNSTISNLATNNSTNNSTSNSISHNTNLINYQYHTQIEHFSLLRSQNNIIMKGITLQGRSEISADKLTMDTNNDWKVEEYQHGQQIFKDNQFYLSLLGLDVTALTSMKSNVKNLDVIQQPLSDLFKQGVNIKLQNIQSTTPWGQIDGQFDIELQRGAILNDMIVNPFDLIDYVNAELSLSLPVALLQQIDIGYLLQMGVTIGALKEEAEQLTLQSTLDRGELIVNGAVFPL